MLEKLKKIDLREQWRHEASDFTQWLSKDENLELLSDEIGIEISLVQSEAKVGSFHVDILAEENQTGRNIVIENQLENTDHDHLGKLITYSSGYDAEIIIWIVKDVRDEHKQAIDWLNENTYEDIYFFIAKIELWQIKDSPYAPKFDIVSKPNNWAKAVKQSTKKSSLSETKIMQLEFWEKFKNFAKDHRTLFSLRKPHPQHWYDISIGTSQAHLSLTVDTRNDQIRCEFYIPDSEELFNGLKEYKKEIEENIDCQLEWMELPNKKASRIRAIYNIDVNDEENWDECFSWLLKKANEFYDVFGKYLNKVDF